MLHQKLLVICFLYQDKSQYAENGELIKGKLGRELKTEDGYEAAKRCGLNIISQVKKACARVIYQKLNLYKINRFC